MLDPCKTVDIGAALAVIDILAALALVTGALGLDPEPSSSLLRASPPAFDGWDTGVEAAWLVAKGAGTVKLVVEALDKRRCRLGVTGRAGRTGVIVVGGIGLGGAAAIGTTPVLMPPVVEGKVVGVVTTEPPFTDP